MIASGRTVEPVDEQFHPHDPDVESWNESWLVSWLPADGIGATLFRLGTLPNQGRAWLWLFTWTGTEWVTIEETRLDDDHLDRGDGVGYDRWGLRFAYRPTVPLETGRFTLSGIGRIRSGPSNGGLVPISIDVELSSSTLAFATGAGRDDGTSAYPTSRFEQSMSARGSVTVGETLITVAGPAHRDRSWGPRTWGYPFMLGDLQAADRQIYFAAAPNAEGGRGGGYVRLGETTQPIAGIEASVDYRDDEATIGPSTLTFIDVDRIRHAYDLEVLAPSVQFDMAHTGQPAQHWLYWRTLVRATPHDGGPALLGWFEANRFPYPTPSEASP